MFSQGYFRDHELIPISEDSEFTVDKILKKNRAKDKTLVTFHGLPETFTQWIDSADLKSNKLFKPLKHYLNDE